MPKTHERLKLWRNAFPKKIDLQKDVNFKLIAQKYDHTGADIMNIAQYVCLKAIADNSFSVTLERLLEGIDRENIKSGKIF